MLNTLAAIPTEQLATFLAGALIVNFAPGQDMIFATACGIRSGPRVGAMAGFGAGLGVMVHVTLAAVGLSAMIAAHSEALTAIKYLGAGYLAYLAWKSWRAGDQTMAGGGATSEGQAFLRGVMSNLLNPKAVLFMLAFLPQFVDPDIGPVWQQVLALGMLFAFGGAVVTAGYGWLAGKAGRMISARIGFVNRIAALLFAGLAARLILTE